MPRFARVLLVFAVLAASPHPSAAQPATSVALNALTWPEARERLTEDAVVVLAYGNASKAHGPHLPLSSDFLQAQFVTDAVAARTPVVVAPSIPYGYYPPFLEYPGSTTLPLSVARDLVTNICRSYARTTRARRFYVVSHGQISRPVFEQAARDLAREGILLRYTDWEAGKAPHVKAVRTQERGSHADEIETSMLLHVAPERVEMAKAVKEYGRAPSAGGYMIGNRPERDGLYSPSGVFGDATAATRDKGRRIVEGLVEFVVKDIERLRTAPLPEAQSLASAVADVAGRYEVAPGDSITVSRDDDLLAVERTGRPPLRLQSAGPNRFGLWTTEARFIVDARGVVTHLLLSADGREVVATRRP